MATLLALGILMIRQVSMVLVPFVDTSEPRYAEIARLMAVSGDWVTPWFEAGTPFWGKPPLSFWLQAASITVFGTSEWAVRLPSWIATGLTLIPIYRVAQAYGGDATARYAVLIYCSSLLPFAMAGAVVTDPFLALGTTLAMAGLVLPGGRWAAAAILGISIGLLSKGPIAAVLVFGPTVITWIAFRRRAWASLPSKRWLWAIVAVAVLVVPWFVLAERRSPGFLNYFLVGEHWRRFVDPGWTGDLYGNAHREPRGTIWVFWLVATFPWGPIAALWIARHLRTQVGRRSTASAVLDPRTAYLLCWATFTPLMFTPARNLLWTYTLPAIPALAILLGRALSRWSALRGTAATRVGLGLLMLTPAASIVLTTKALVAPQSIKTERSIVHYAEKRWPHTPVWYIDRRPFSARFYSRGSAPLVTMDELSRAIDKSGCLVPIAVRQEDIPRAARLVGLQQIPTVRSQRFVLATIPVQPDNAIAPIPAHQCIRNPSR